MELTSIEKERYARQIVLKDFGLDGQQKLKAGSIIVVGAGGLGSSLLLYLAAAGIGKITIIDGDVVQLNNLQRQIIFSQKDIGLNKAKVAKEKILALNEHIEVNIIEAFLNEENIHKCLTAGTLIADCSDNFKTRYLINDFVVANNATLISASVYKHQMQIGVFNYPYQDALRSATYRCAFPENNMGEIQDSCAQTGVLGLVPGVAGMLMANEIIKILTLSEDVIYNKLLLLDLQTINLKQLNIKRKIAMQPAS